MGEMQNSGMPGMVMCCVSLTKSLVVSMGRRLAGWNDHEASRFYG